LKNKGDDMKIYLRMIAIIFLHLIMTGVFLQTTSASVQLARPANNALCVMQTDTLFWNQYPDSWNYEVIVSNTPSMAVLLYDYITINTFYVPSEYDQLLDIGITYYWRVRVTYGKEGQPAKKDSSALWSFTIKYRPPLLTGPNDNAVCQPKNVTLQWSYDLGFSFKLQVSTVSNFTSTVIDMSNISTNSQTVTLPNYLTKYYWRVAAVNNGCTSDWSTTRSLTSLQAPPTLISPADKATASQISIPFKWAAAGNPTSHEIQVATDSQFNNVIADLDNTIQLDTIYLGSVNSDYFWRVRSTYSNCETDWSSSFSFSTAYTPPATQIPQKDSTCVPIFTRLSWTAASGATSYRLNIAEDMNFSKIVINRGKILSLSDTATLPKGLMKYYWQVRGEDGSNAGPWSDTSNFTTAVAVPERISPVDNDSGGIDVTFKWKPMAAGTTYRIQVSNSTNFGSPLLDKSLDITSYQYTLPNYGKPYYWRIMASLVVCQGIWSSGWKYKTILMSPTLISPPDNSKKQSLKPKMQWSAALGAQKYSIQIAKNITFNPVLINKSGLYQPNYQVDAELDTNTLYYWRVYSSNSDGISSWSNIFSFTTGGPGPDIPALSAPQDKSEGWDTKLVVKWKSALRANTYHLQISEADDFQNNAVDLDNLLETTFAVTILENGKTYYWRVASINDIGTSNWSETWSFKTQAIAPSDAAVLQQPPDGSTDLPADINFSWAIVPRADIYDFQLATESQFDTPTIIFSDTNLSSNSKYMTTIPYDSQLFWRVRGRNDGGKGPWSNPWKFKTLVNSVSDERLAAVYKINITPNPANESVSVSFNLPEEKNVVISIVNLLGVELTRTEETSVNYGQNIMNLNLRNLSSGSYIIKISIGTFNHSQCLIIEK